MAKKGRPRTAPSALKDGWYIELRNEGDNSGIKIHRDTKREMELAVELYKNTKDVIILGEYKNGKPVNDKKKRKKKTKKKK